MVSCGEGQHLGAINSFIYFYSGDFANSESGARYSGNANPPSLFLTLPEM